MKSIAINCDTGETSEVDLTPDEIETYQRVQSEAVAAEQAALAKQADVLAQRQADGETVLAALPTQEARDAMARLLGLA